MFSDLGENVICAKSERVIDVDDQSVAFLEELQILAGVKQARIKTGRIEAREIDHLGFDIERVYGGDAGDAVRNFSLILFPDGLAPITGLLVFL